MRTVQKGASGDNQTSRRKVVALELLQARWRLPVLEDLLTGVVRSLLHDYCLAICPYRPLVQGRDVFQEVQSYPPFGQMSESGTTKVLILPNNDLLLKKELSNLFDVFLMLC
jgi:hypothetical protein